MTVPSQRYGKENTETYVGSVLVADQLSVGDPLGLSKTASATSGAATLNTPSGTVTSESITTAASGVYTLTLTNSCVAASDIVLVTVGKGTTTTGVASVATVTPAAGSVVIVISNDSTSAAFNGTIIVSFVIVKL